jgi:hypothetical protein
VYSLPRRVEQNTTNAQAASRIGAADLILELIAEKAALLAWKKGRLAKLYPLRRAKTYTKRTQQAMNAGFKKLQTKSR